MTKIKNIALTLSAIVLFAANSFAGTVTNTSKAIYVDPSSEKLIVNFIGEENGYLVFQVAVNKGANKMVSLTLKDKTEDELLYNSNVLDNKTQTFKVEKRDNQELEFSVKAGKVSYSKSFTIIPTVTLSKL
jgi:hypothetical protein